jgi:hypothetical protein
VVIPVQIVLRSFRFGLFSSRRVDIRAAMPDTAAMSAHAASVIDHPPAARHSFAGAARLDQLDLLEFTIELTAGWAARKSLDATADRMLAAGLDVSYADRRSGMLGCTRRFTVRGPRPLVLDLVAAFEHHGSWDWKPSHEFHAGLAAQRRCN